MCHYWLLVNHLVMLIDSYRSMIVRFAVRVTRGFLSPLLCLSLDILFMAKENLWDQGSDQRDKNSITTKYLAISEVRGNLTL